MLELVANLLGVVKEWFGFQSKRLDLKNSTAVQAAAQQQAEAKEVNKSESAVAKKDINEVRNEIAE